MILLSVDSRLRGNDKSKFRILFNPHSLNQFIRQFMALTVGGEYRPLLLNSYLNPVGLKLGLLA